MQLCDWAWWGWQGGWHGCGPGERPGGAGGAWWELRTSCVRVILNWQTRQMLANCKSRARLKRSQGLVTTAEIAFDKVICIKPRFSKALYVLKLMPYCLKLSNYSKKLSLEFDPRKDSTTAFLSQNYHWVCFMLIFKNLLFVELLCF